MESGKQFLSKIPLYNIGGATDWYNNLIALMTRNVAVNLIKFVINSFAQLR